jgi:hypothetical protein
LALGEPNLHWQVGVGDNVHSVKLVTVPPVTLPATPDTKVPVVVELFQHPLGRPANHDWTINQRSVVLTQDTPYLNAGDHNRPNPISDFPTQVSAIKIHPGPDYDPRAQYEVHLFQGENYSGEYAIRTLALGEPNLHWEVGVGDNVHSLKFVTPQE